MLAFIVAVTPALARPLPQVPGMRAAAPVPVYYDHDHEVCAHKAHSTRTPRATHRKANGSQSRIAFAPQSFRDRKSTHQTELNVWSGPQAIKRQPPLYKQQQQPVPPPPVEWVPPVAYQAAATKPVYYDHDAEVHNPP